MMLLMFCCDQLWFKDVCVLSALYSLPVCCCFVTRPEAEVMLSVGSWDVNISCVLHRATWLFSVIFGQCLQLFIIMPFRVWSKYAWNCVVDSQVTLNHWFTSTRLCFYFVLLLVLLVYCLVSAGCQFELSCCFYVQYLWFCVLIVDLFCFCFASFLAHVLYMCFHLYTDRSFCLKVALLIVLAENANLRSLRI